MRSCLPHNPVVTRTKLVCRSISRSPASPVLRSKGQRQVVPAPQQQQHQQRNMSSATPAAVPAAVSAALAGISIGLLAAWIDAKLKSRKPDLYFTPNAFNSAVLDRCPTMQSTYQCTPFLTNGHAETILVAKLRKAPGVVYKREILLTKDGGAVTVDWEHVDDDGKALPEDAPVLILFPGLTGGSGDSYVQHAVLQARHAGVRAAVFNSRGTADSPVLTPQFYSASFTEDTREVIAHVRSRYPSSTLYAAGWSLGANILVNYLGEQGPDTPLAAAVSMCNPFDLTISNRHINEGFNKIYNWNLASSLKRIFLKHQPLWRTYSGPGQPELVPAVKTIREFDEAITVHSFDWKDVDAYYAGSSSAKRIPHVAIPLLCIQAADDPIAPEEAIPYQAIKQNPNCTLVVTPCGGHLGWAAGAGAPFSEPWTDAAVVEWLISVHAQLQQEGQGGGNRTGAAAAAAAGVVEAAQQQQQQDRDDEDGGNGGRGSNGGSGSNGGGGAPARELVETVAAAAGRTNSSSSAFTAATLALSRQPSSSSSGGSSAFASPVTSPASSDTSAAAAAAAVSRPGTAVSTASSVGSSRSRRQHHDGQQQQQQSMLAAAAEGNMLAAERSQPEELMEQLWWGQQGASNSSSSSSSRKASMKGQNMGTEMQQQRQQQPGLWSRRQTAASTLSAGSQVSSAAPSRLPSGSAPEQAMVPAAAAAAAAAAAGVLAAVTVVAEEQQQQQEQVLVGEQQQQQAHVSPFAAAAYAGAVDAAVDVSSEAPAATSTSTATAASSGDLSAGAAVQRTSSSGDSSAAAVEAAEQELWQSVRWAF